VTSQDLPATDDDERNDHQRPDTWSRTLSCSDAPVGGCSCSSTALIWPSA
jgi:hypothetical protein